MRRHGRTVHEGDVGVPEVGPVLAAVDGVDLFALEHLRLDGVALGQLAETAGERDLGVVVEVLVGEEDHEALEPDAADGGDDVVIEVGRAVDAVDLGADGGAQGADVEVDAADRHASMLAAGRKRGRAPAGVYRTRCSMASGFAMFSSMRARCSSGDSFVRSRMGRQDEAEHDGARRR